MRHLFIIVMIVLVAVSLTGCKFKKALDEAQIADDLKDRGTSDLLKEASKDKYDAPADRRLSDAQIQMYLKVRDREKAIAQVAKKELESHAKEAKDKGEKSLGGLVQGFKALGSVADFVTADIRAAKDLGFNTAEYQWVKERVLEASGSAMSQKMQEATKQMYETSRSQLKAQAEQATDESQKKMFADMLAQMESSQAEVQAQQEEPHVVYNRTALAKYENVLNALTQEISKWEEKPGEAQKNVDDFQKKLDESAKSR